MRLTEGFNLLATAPDGIKRLRELILSLAVQGKLVPQDPNDEPASELLKQIRLEKERLIADGKIKKDKPLPAIGDDEKPFELPKSWEWTRLSEISVFITDGEHTTPERTEDTTQIPLVTAKNVRDGVMDYGVTDFVPRHVAEKCWQRCKPEEGDILMVSVGATLGRLSILDKAREMVLVRSVTVIRPAHQAIDNRYLSLYLKAPLTQIAIWASVKQSAQPCLYLAKTNMLLLALPPLAEQSRIVAKVEELMVLCDVLEARGQLEAEQHARLTATLFDALAASESAHALQENWERLAASFDLVLDRPQAVDALEQTLLQLAVRGLLVPQDPTDEPASELLKQIRAEKDRLIAEGKIKKDKPLPAITDEEKPFDLPQGWEWVALETIASVGTGTTPSRDNSTYFTPPEISWVTSGETGQPFIEKTEQYVSPTALKETSLAVYPVGTLIVAMYGQGKTRGQISELCIPAATNQACAAIVLPIVDTCLRKYVKLYFEKIYDEIRLEAAGGAQPNLNVGKVKSTLISLPPLAEQSRIVTRVEALRALCGQLRERLATSRQTQAHLAEALVAQT